MFKELTRDIANTIVGLQQVEKNVAKRLLRSTVADFPRPPFDTGTLRRSGRAYVNGVLVSSTHRMREAQGRNPNTASRKRNPLSKKTLSSGSHSEQTDTFGPESSVSSTGIEIVYKTPYAAKMHSWHGSVTDNESGPGFITSKFHNIKRFLNEELTRIY